MPQFSANSLSKLATCDERLQQIMKVVIEHWDCTIVEGSRPQEVQDEHYRTGRSKVQYPHSKHNSSPSAAIDVAPYPIDWNDVARFRYFAGFVMGVATMHGVKLIWGGDWDSDRSCKDQTFHDLPHFELAE